MIKLTFDIAKIDAYFSKDSPTPVEIIEVTVNSMLKNAFRTYKR